MEGSKKLVKVFVIIIILLFCVFIGFLILAGIWPYHPPKVILCHTNARALDICCRVYHMDEQIWPNPNNWCDLIKPYLYEEKRNSFLCPADKTGPCSYAMNENIPADGNELPGDLVVLFESAPGWNAVGGVEDVVTDRHDRPGANIAFADGRVEFVEAAEIAKLRWTMDDAGFPPARE